MRFQISELKMNYLINEQWESHLGGKCFTLPILCQGNSNINALNKSQKNFSEEGHLICDRNQKHLYIVIHYKFKYHLQLREKL